MLHELMPFCLNMCLSLCHLLAEKLVALRSIVAGKWLKNAAASHAKLAAGKRKTTKEAASSSGLNLIGPYCNTCLVCGRQIGT